MRDAAGVRPAVFLDRDGTLNEEVHYLDHPDHFRLLPGVGQALSRLSEAGFALVVVTNQSGVARGYFSEEVLGEIHERMRAELALHQVELLDVLHCPHHPEAGQPPLRRQCACRKPAPGMLLEAADRHQLDLSASWMVGDAARDALAGERAGCRSILLCLDEAIEWRGARARDLAEATDLILAQGK